MKNLALIIFSLVTVCGCSIKSMANAYLIESLQSSQNSVQQSSNYQLVERAMPTFIVLVDSAVEDEPENVPLLIKAAELNTSFALSFLEEKDPKWAGLHYLRAKQCAAKALALKYDLKIEEIVGKQEKEVEKRLSGMDEESVPYLFWLGMSWGLHVNVNRDDVKIVGEFPYVRLIMEKVLALNPSFQNGLPHLFFGVYYGSMPKTLGGKPEESRKHFEKVIELTKGEFLLPKVLYATTCAKSEQDRKLFKKLLQEVINAPVAKNPNFNLSNAMSKKQADALLYKIDEYFIPDPKEEEEEEEEE